MFVARAQRSSLCRKSTVVTSVCDAPQNGHLFHGEISLPEGKSTPSNLGATSGCRNFTGKGFKFETSKQSISLHECFSITSNDHAV